MIVKFTPDENRRKDEIFDLLIKLNDDQRKHREAEEKTYPLPESATQYEGIEQLISSQERQAARNKIKEDLDEWDKNAPPEWKVQRQAADKLFTQRRAEIHTLFKALYDEAEQRTMNELGGDPGRILQHAKEQVTQTIESKISEFESLIADPNGTSLRDRALVSLGRDQWALDLDTMSESITSALKRHYQALEGKKNHAEELLIDQLNSYINKTLKDHPKIAKPGQGIPGGEVTCTDALFISTVRVRKHVSTIDKVSTALFQNKLTEKTETLELWKSRGKMIGIIAGSTFINNALKGTSLNYYDRRVLNAMLSLYDAGNKYMSIVMIYEKMTGQEDIKVTESQDKAINDSILKFMGTVLTIDFTNEMNARGYDGKYKLKENLIHATMVERKLNGIKTACVQILKTPILYEYADRANNQISRLDRDAISMPLNYTPLTTALHEYLLSRILAMKGGDNIRNIPYDTIYRLVLEDKAKTSTRTEKNRLRGHVDTMLTNWATEKGCNLIKGHSKYYAGKRAKGIEIDL